MASVPRDPVSGRGHCAGAVWAGLGGLGRPSVCLGPIKSTASGRNAVKNTKRMQRFQNTISTQGIKLHWAAMETEFFTENLGSPK